MYSYVKFLFSAIFDCCISVIRVHTYCICVMCVNSIAVIASYWGELLVPIYGCEYALGSVLRIDHEHIHCMQA